MAYLYNRILRFESLKIRLRESPQRSLNSFFKGFKPSKKIIPQLLKTTALKYDSECFPSKLKMALGIIELKNNKKKKLHS